MDSAIIIHDHLAEQIKDEDTIFQIFKKHYYEKIEHSGRPFSDANGPDIIVQIGRKRVGFQLSEIVDNDAKKSDGDCESIRRAVFDKVVCKKPGEHIVVSLEQSGSQKELKKLVDPISQAINSMQEGQTFVNHKHFTVWKHVLAEGRAFSLCVSSWHDNNASVIKSFNNKNRKGYSTWTDGNIELLLHYNTPDVIRKENFPRIKAFLESQIESSRFSRVWIFDAASDRIDLVIENKNKI